MSYKKVNSKITLCMVILMVLSFFPISFVQSNTQLPEAYDLREEGRTTEAKNQGKNNGCWAFSALGSLESQVLTTEGKTKDFSESNMMTQHGFDLKETEGGNMYMATAYLASWKGAIEEKNDPYPGVGEPLINRGSKTPDYKVQDVYFLPNRENFVDNDLIKKSIMQYGAVYSNLKWKDEAYNKEKNAYFNDSLMGYDHTVVIVGWDDAFEKEQFDNPSIYGDGAFICKNSWGNTWGDEGYFYVSYYDFSIGKTENAVFLANTHNGLEKNYQYDPLGQTDTIGFSKTEAWFANVFKSESDERINAVSFYTTKPNSSYEVWIKHYADGKNWSGMEKISQGKHEFSGYHTVEVSPVMIKEKEPFAVVVKIHSPGANEPIAIESPVSKYSSAAKSHSGQSYISSNGIEWTDVTQLTPNANVCLKVFTTPIDKSVLVNNIKSELNVNGDVENKRLLTSTLWVKNQGKETKSLNFKMDLEDLKGTVVQFHEVNVQLKANETANLQLAIQVPDLGTYKGKIFLVDENNTKESYFLSPFIEVATKSSGNGDTTDKTALKREIELANANKGTVKVSENGLTIDVSQIWVTQKTMSKYEEEIVLAQKVLTKIQSTQIEINNAIETLKKATLAFNSEKLKGNKPADEATLNNAITKVLDYYMNKKPMMPSDGWEAYVGMWSSDKPLDETLSTQYSWMSKAIDLEVHTAGSAHIHYIFSLICHGQNPENAFDTNRNLYAELANQQNKVNGSFGNLGKHIWSIVALDLGVEQGAEIPGWNEGARAKAIEYLLSMQKSDGSFSSTDYTSWALIPLSHSSKAEAAKSIDQAKKYLKSIQKQSGGFGENEKDSENANSTACAIQGLIAIGEDVASQTGYWSQNGQTPLTALLSYQNATGGFNWEHQRPGAVEQATKQALVALADVKNGESSWYRLEHLVATHGKTDMGVLKDAIREAELERESVFVSEKGMSILETSLWVSEDEMLRYETEIQKAKKLLSKTSLSQSDVEKAVLELKGHKQTFNQKKQHGLKKIAVISLPNPDENHTVKVPVNTNKGESIVLVPKNKTELNLVIELPTGQQSKLFVQLPQNQELPKIETHKNNVWVVLPRNVKVMKGNASELEWMTDKSEIGTAMKNQLSNSLPTGRTLDKVVNAFTLGGIQHIEFNDWIEIRYKGMKGSKVAYIEQSKMIPIKEYPNNTQGLSSGSNDYAYVEGNDLIVKTKHFTDFVLYTDKADDSNSNGSSSEVITFSVEKRMYDGKDIISQTEVPFVEGDTAFSVLKRETDKRNIKVRTYGSGESIYVSGIDGLNEFDGGAQSGWIYSVNGAFFTTSAGSYKLKKGDVLCWQYTKNLGKDLGNTFTPSDEKEKTSNKKAVSKSDLTTWISESANWILKKRDFKVYDRFSDWDMVALLRSGKSVSDNYLKVLETYIVEKQGNLRLITDYQRIVLVLTAVGKDPSNFKGYDLLEKIYNNENMLKQGINGPVYALIALDSKNYEVPADALWTREKLIGSILNQQNSDGGFSLSSDSNSESDLDITSMVLQAFSKYQDRPEIKESTRRALEWLTKNKLKHIDTESLTSESLSQLTLALCSLGLDVEDKQYEIAGKSLISTLTDYIQKSGGFSHKKGLESDPIATQQGLMALTAYHRYLEKNSAVYHMQDVVISNKKADAVFEDAHDISVWAVQNVTLAYEKGLMLGVSKDGMKFAPKRALTRAEFTAIMVNLFAKDSVAQEGSKFIDVTQEDWFYNDVMVAKQKGWISGLSEERFAPKSVITRQEMAVIISRVLNLQTRDEVVTSLDLKEIPRWAQKQVKAVVQMKLMLGDGESFGGNTKVTREMAATIAIRLYETYLK